MLKIFFLRIFLYSNKISNFLDHRNFFFISSCPRGTVIDVRMSGQYSGPSSSYSNDTTDGLNSNRAPKDRKKDSWYANKYGNKDKERRSTGGKRPAHLKGKEIGLWYAARQKEKNKKLQDEPIAEVCLTRSRRNKIKQILSTVEDRKIQNENWTFKRKFRNTSSGNIESRYSKIISSQLENDTDLDEALKDELQQKIESNKKYHEYFEVRRKLPCFDKKDEILEAIWNNQITLISGETGCGKTTQIPQYILDKYILEGNGSAVKIVCTQPRRISAISVCERVADERVEMVGEMGNIGYQIRLEKNIPRSQGSITFCTTGVVLKQMESDPYLTNVTHIILDEIHERNTVCDFLLTLLKTLVTKRPDLKLILMSATFNSDAFAKYFGNNCAQVTVPGFTYPVQEYYLEDVIKLTNHRFQESKFSFRNYKNKSKIKEFQDFIEPYVRQIRDFKRYPNYVCQELVKPESEQIDLLLIQKLISDICKEGEGAILVFLPGYSDISQLCKMLRDSHQFPSHLYRIYPLHSQLPTVQQKEIFQVPPTGIRKIIIATNIAETSITINDVVYVVDCGKIKISNYNAEKNLDSLNPEWVSVANADQRRGRAGRVRPGICYHLFSRARKQLLETQQKPEILRTRLESVILQMKILQLGQAEIFLSKLMDPPTDVAIQKALSILHKMDALDHNENLTPLGYLLATLPMNPQMGKMLLLGTFFSCLDPILSVAASLDFKDAFLITIDKETEAKAKRKSLKPNSMSDHLILHEALDRYDEARKYGNTWKFCREYFLSSYTLGLLLDMKKQLAEYLRDMKFISNSNYKDEQWNANSDDEALVKAVIAAGLYPNVALITKCIAKSRKSIMTIEKEKVDIVSGSVNAEEMHFLSPLLVYFTKWQSLDCIWIRDTTVIHPMSLLFFGDDLQIEENVEKCIVQLNAEYPLKFTCNNEVVDLIVDLKKKFNEVLEWKVSNPEVIDWNEEDRDEIKILRAVARLISSEETRMFLKLTKY